MQLNGMFDNYRSKIGVHKKKDYEALFDIFMRDNRACLEEMLKSVEQSENREQTAQEIADEFVKQVVSDQVSTKKIARNRLLDLSLYMVYFVFPAFIKIRSKEEAKTLADAIRDAWRAYSGNKEFDYTTYEDIYLSFNEKFLGLF